MATIITRQEGGTAKGAELSYAELDNNFINLNTDKYESGADAVFESVTSNTITATSITTDSFTTDGITSNTGTINIFTATTINTDGITANTVDTNSLTSTDIAAGNVTSNTGSFTSLTSTDITATDITANNFNTTSDYRLKDRITNLDSPVSKSIDNLRVVSFNFKDTPSETEVGFIAHEVQEIFPDLVTGEKDGDEIQTIKLVKLIPYLVKALQECNARIAELESR